MKYHSLAAKKQVLAIPSAWPYLRAVYFIYSFERRIRSPIQVQALRVQQQVQAEGAEVRVLSTGRRRLKAV